MPRTPAARRLSQRALVFLALLAPAAAAACGGDDGLTTPASIENTTRVYSVYALSGSSSAFPAAYAFNSERLARPQILSTGAVNFDVAFDIGADNKVRLIPARVAVPSPPIAPPVIGLQSVAGGYPALQRAPERGYQYDSTGVLGVGDTYAVEIRSSGCYFSEPFYAKLTIDSILPAERRIVVRSIVNRNCGYRALTEGLPKN